MRFHHTRPGLRGGGFEKRRRNWYRLGLRSRQLKIPLVHPADNLAPVRALEELEFSRQLAEGTELWRGRNLFQCQQAKLKGKLLFGRKRQQDQANPVDGRMMRRPFGK